MRWEEIREEGLHACRRFFIPYRCGDPHQGVLRLDVGFGDPVHPLPRWIDITRRFEGHLGGRILAYPVETILAGKIQTIPTRGVLSTRAKDIHDVWTLARMSDGLRLAPVAEALRTVAAHRGTDLARFTAPLRKSFAEDLRQVQVWKGFVAREPLAAPPFADVVQEMRAFVEGIHQACVEGPQGSDVWRVESWTWDEAKGKRGSVGHSEGA